jgi:predicted HTH domain antitoxin
MKIAVYFLLGGKMMQVVVNIPDQYFIDVSTSELADRLKLSAALLMFQSGQLSAGAACEFADIDRYAFWGACKRYNIDTVNYDPDELKEDLVALTQKEAD